MVGVFLNTFINFVKGLYGLKLTQEDGVENKAIEQAKDLEFHLPEFKIEDYEAPPLPEYKLPEYQESSEILYNLSSRVINCIM